MTEDIDFTDVVDHHFNIDGPHDADTIITALWSASRLLRYVAHATYPGKDHLQYGPQVYRAVGAVDSLVGTLSQVTEQLGDALDVIAEDPTLYDDRRSEEHEGRVTALMAAAVLQEDVTQAVRSAQRPLHDAHTLTGRLGHDT